MRILFLNHNVAFTGGTFNRALDIGHYLSTRGHEVTLLSISKSNRWAFSEKWVRGVHLFETPDLLVGRARTGWDLYDALRRAGFVAKRDWDLIHAWDCRPVVILPALVARRVSGAPLFIDWCDWWGRGGTIQERSGWVVRTFFGPVETFFEEAFRTSADRTTVISTALRERAVRLGVPRETIHLMPHGCDPVHVQPRDRAAARARLGLPPAISLIGSVGRLQGRDGSLMWETVRLVVAARPATQLVLIGDHRAQVPSDLRAGGHIIETGFVSDDELADYVAAADLMLTPLADTIASRGRWPSKVNYYLSAGKAVVLSRVGDLPLLLEQERAALVCAPTSADLARGVLHLLEQPHLRAELERHARRVAETLLSWSALVDKLELLYRAAERTSARVRR
ncbi:MAG: glycosyltransferase family 4 protein [Chloroflexota bacterium]|nr:glycosyltransferase family 4 protein [Dehalococcoidia bacterium]MDW8252644.1 glycosyltransferase family 4 protein [Chloroflexota bacterium]